MTLDSLAGIWLLEPFTFHFPLMANTKSAIKNARKAGARATRNKTVKTRLKTLTKKLQKAAAEGKAADAKTLAIQFSSALDKATKSNVISKNSAARHKSQVAKYIFAK